jgi:hypothetical protein
MRGQGQRFKAEREAHEIAVNDLYNENRTVDSIVDDVECGARDCMAQIKRPKHDFLRARRYIKGTEVMGISSQIMK